MKPRNANIICFCAVCEVSSERSVFKMNLFTLLLLAFHPNDLTDVSEIILDDVVFRNEANKSSHILLRQ